MIVHKLIFGKACHLPMELEQKAFWVIKELICIFEIIKVKRLMQMSELEEIKNEAHENARINKRKVKNGMIKSFLDKNSLMDLMFYFLILDLSYSYKN
ncbi:hypothetical protein MA16_Dca008103 [Dendrobium catenatum]|uniref:Uncharacterized protein n=1 Tax=Dendrobium catenatum TaxID=906689 RepID=A0A2I0WD03_9ASPA|nr:hypothetical protein MA16_Dca008103 [Dendrobium catenatum]